MKSTAETSTSAHLSVHRPPVSTSALIVGAAFLLVGVLGFIPGITTDYSSMAAAGTGSMAMLLGIFQVSVLHNIVHLAFGAVGLLAARATAAARAYLLIGGVVYLALWIYGLVISANSSANFVPLNTADNWLHLILGVGMVVLGLVMPRRTSTGTAVAEAGPSAGGRVQ